MHCVLFIYENSMCFRKSMPCENPALVYHYWNYKCVFHVTVSNYFKIMWEILCKQLDLMYLVPKMNISSNMVNIHKYLII